MARGRSRAHQEAAGADLLDVRSARRTLSPILLLPLRVPFLTSGKKFDVVDEISALGFALLPAKLVLTGPALTILIRVGLA